MIIIPMVLWRISLDGVLGDIFSATRFYVLGTHEINLGSETLNWLGDGSYIYTSPNSGQTSYTAFSVGSDFTSGSFTAINGISVGTLGVSFSYFPYLISEDTIPTALPPFDAINNPAQATLFSEH